MTPSTRYTLHATRLDTPISSLSKLSKEHVTGLKRLNLNTIQDLLFYFPVRYADANEVSSIENLEVGSTVTLYGIMEKVSVRRSFKGHIPMTEARIRDNSGLIRAIWFNQAYIGKMYPEETRVKISGKVQSDGKGFFLSNPQIEKAPLITPESEESLFGGKSDGEFLTPIYRETSGVSSLFLLHLIKRAVTLGVLDNISDPIPSHTISKLHLPKLKDAFIYIHFPKNENLTIAARKRFAFEEIFYLQIKQHIEKAEANHSLAYPIKITKEHLQDFVSSFNFKPTKAQLESIDSILKDLSKKNPMGRLLEGDVGSGKTFVAACASYAVIQNDTKDTPLQVGYMAPTEILAKQHFESFIKFFEGTDISIGFLTSGGCKKFPSKTDPNTYTDISRAQLLKWVSEGKINIVIGTHALIQKSVEWKDLALVIIDEQHRFGVKQRKSLAHKKGDKKKELPHLLSMTATPIPRTLALSIFGDLDLSVIDEMPVGRKKIITEIVPSLHREKVYKHIKEELEKGRQVYVICPRIEEPDDEERAKKTIRSVKEEANRLSENIFPEYVIDIVHSKMKADEKGEVMLAFKNKEINILVATSVVEVGVDIPNATVMIIEGAEKFGLAQLHQLRGRVGRSSEQSYCYIFTESTNEQTLNRLNVLTKAKNGFELAEMDMMQRGIGTLFDGKQWGVSDLAMEAIKNPKLVEVARQEAKEIIENDLSLENFPKLKEKLKEKQEVHME